MASVEGGNKDVLSLNIMPMLDIFSILITFLLMSFSTDPVSHDIRAGLELPTSLTLKSLDEIPAIVVTKTEIFVNDKKVADIFAGDVPERDRSQGAVFPVFKELEKLAEVNRRIQERARRRGSQSAESEGDGNKDPGTLTVEMDQSHKFKLIKRILLAAQQAEFIKFKFMVVKENS